MYNLRSYFLIFVSLTLFIQDSVYSQTAHEITDTPSKSDISPERGSTGTCYNITIIRTICENVTTPTIEADTTPVTEPLITTTITTENVTEVITTTILPITTTTEKITIPELVNVAPPDLTKENIPDPCTAADLQVSSNSDRIQISFLPVMLERPSAFIFRTTDVDNAAFELTVKNPSLETMTFNYANGVWSVNNRTANKEFKKDTLYYLTWNKYDCFSRSNFRLGCIENENNKNSSEFKDSLILSFRKAYESNPTSITVKSTDNYSAMWFIQTCPRPEQLDLIPNVGC